MKRFNLFKELCLQETEGWQYIPFMNGKQNTFYTYMIENMETSLAWVAMKRTITEKDLSKHHFARTEQGSTGLTNSLPRLLIITDGKRWFISKIGSEKFTETRYTQVLAALCENVKAILDHYSKTSASKERVLAILQSIELIKMEVRKYGENIPEYSINMELDLFCNTKAVIMDGHKAKPEMAMVSKRLQELSIQSMQANMANLSKILHNILFGLVNTKQLQFLQKFSDLQVYVNPWQSANKLLMCLAKAELYGDKRNADQKCMYLLIDKQGHSKPLSNQIKDIDREIYPGLFKLDFRLVTEFLDRDPF